MADEWTNDGKKILLLFMPAEEEDRVLKILVDHEFESYSISSQNVFLLPAIHAFTNSIIFAFESNCPKNIHWKDQFEKLNARSDESGNLVSTWHSESDALRLNSEMSNFSPPVQEIALDRGFGEIAHHLVPLLESMNARGRRAHVRIRCGFDYSATFSIKNGSSIHSGSILDISSNAMACVFTSPVELIVHTHLPDIQLRLNSKIIQLTGDIFNRRDIEGRTVYIIVFDFTKTPEAKIGIREFIRTSLQRHLKNMKIAAE